MPSCRPVGGEPLRYGYVETRQPLGVYPDREHRQRGKQPDGERSQCHGAASHRYPDCRAGGARAGASTRAIQRDRRKSTGGAGSYWM